jgi:hypothetical protein
VMHGLQWHCTHLSSPPPSTFLRGGSVRPARSPSG